MSLKARFALQFTDFHQFVMPPAFNESAGSAVPNISAVYHVLCARSQGLVAEGRHEAATKKTISKISGQRSAEMDRMVAEAAATRQELEATRVKCEAAIARWAVACAHQTSSTFGCA